MAITPTKETHTSTTNPIPNAYCVILGTPGTDPLTIVGPFETINDADDPASQHPRATGASMMAKTTIAEWRAKALGAESRIDLAFRRLQLGLLRSGYVFDGTDLEEAVRATIWLIEKGRHEYAPMFAGPRSECGCPDRPDEKYQEHPDEPCDWSHWHPNQFSEGLREDRFCWKCGSMETQELKLWADAPNTPEQEDCCVKCGAARPADKRHKHEVPGWKPTYNDFEGALEGYEITSRRTEQVGREIKITLTTNERDAMIIWAGMACVGFVYGGEPDPHDPNVTALKKLQATRADRSG